MTDNAFMSLIACMAAWKNIPDLNSGKNAAAFIKSESCL